MHWNMNHLLPCFLDFFLSIIVVAFSCPSSSGGVGLGDWLVDIFATLRYFRLWSSLRPWVIGEFFCAFEENTQDKDNLYHL